MARRRRTDEQHGYFHVWNRGVDRQDIFIDDRDREVFVDLLADAAEEFGVEVHAYSLMSNHFHLVVNCPQGQLSSFAQRVQKRYVEHHNERAERVGHLFTGRFSSTLLTDQTSPDQSDDVMMAMVRYVHRNPLDRMSIGDLEADRFSSYGVYLGRHAAPTWLRTDVVMTLHGDRGRIRSFTERPHPSDKTPEHGREIEPYTVDDVIVCVSEQLGLAREAVLGPVRGRPNSARDLAAHLCLSLRVGVVVDLATEFGVSMGGFRRSAARAKGRCAVDPSWAACRVSVREALWIRHNARRFRVA